MRDESIFELYLDYLSSYIFKCPTTAFPKAETCSKQCNWWKL